MFGISIARTFGDGKNSTTKYHEEYIQMSNILKDMAALLFSMGEELEKKAEEYKNTREARQEEFEQKIRQQKEDLKEKYQGDMDSMKDKLSETAGKIGLATKEEIEELKTLMKDLSEKIDNMNK